MTLDEFLMFPEDDIHREWIRGAVRDQGSAIHSPAHSRCMTLLAWHLRGWLDCSPHPRGEVVCGECGFFLRGRETSLVGIDVAYVGAGLVASTNRHAWFYEGPPVLAVEILEASDPEENIAELLALYQEFGAIVWIADPALRTASVHRPGQRPESFHETQDLVGDPYLPGFRVPVARLFD